MQKQIIALGGGGFSMEPDNPLLDEYILEQSGKEKPKICFLPTAGRDPEDYIERFYKVYDKLTCEPSHLALVKNPISADKLEDYILEKDIIFVGGGSTRVIMSQWKKWGLDKILQKAWEKGIVLSGMSAGAICWFEDGIFNPTHKQLLRLECLGFLEGSFCPHYDERTELRHSFRQMILTKTLKGGYGAEDGAAIHFIEDKLHKVITSRKSAKAFTVYKKGRRIIEEQLDCEFLGKKEEERKSEVKDTTDVVLSFVKNINDHNLEGLLDLISDDHRFTDSLGIDITGKEEVEEAWNGFFMLFPNYQISVEDIIQNSSIIGIYGRAGGTYAANGLLSIENTFEIPASWKAVVKDNKISEWRVYADNEAVREIIKNNRNKA